MNKINVKQIALIAILLLFWGVYSSISKLLLNGYDSLSLLFFMYVTSAIAITLYMFVTKKIKIVKYTSKRELLIYSLIALFSFLYYLLYFLALKNAPAFEITTINYLFPLFIAFLAVPINKEKMTIKKAIALLLGFLGVVVMISGGNLKDMAFTNITADLLMLIGAISWALLTTVSKIHVKNQETFTFIAIIVQLVACIIVLPFFTKLQFPTITQLAGATWLGVTNLVICFLIWQKLVSRLKASTIASIAFITPFINLLAIVLILGEKLTLGNLLGFLIVITGISIQSVSFHFKKRLVRKSSF